MTECKSSAWIGLDVGKKTFSAAIDLPADGRRRKLTDIPCREFARTPRGVEDFLAWAEKTAAGLPAGIVMETTGCYSQHLADWIGKSRPSIPVTIENARALHAFIQSLNLPHKTDRLDAQAIARFGTERRPEPSSRPSPAILTLRELSRERAALIKVRTELQNRRDSLSTEVARRHNARTLATLTTQIEMLDDEIRACVVEDTQLLAEVHVMTTMPGVKFVSAYSSEGREYLLHWLADVDDWYGFSKGTTGEGKFTFINTFQRGEQESCFETVPAPCLEELKWGIESTDQNNGNGIKAIFNGIDKVPSQYAFTNAPDAEDRAIQAIYFANMKVV